VAVTVLHDEVGAAQVASERQLVRARVAGFVFAAPMLGGRVGVGDRSGAARGARKPDDGRAFGAGGDHDVTDRIGPALELETEREVCLVLPGVVAAVP
jgi:hypothetical protein